LHRPRKKKKKKTSHICAITPKKLVVWSFSRILYEALFHLVTKQYEI